MDGLHPAIVRLPPATTATLHPFSSRNMQRKHPTDSGIHSRSHPAGFPNRLRIKPRNHEVTEQACRGCHQDMVIAIEGPHSGDDYVSCVRCHSSVGHLR
jgi:hypothetical protein